MRSRAVILGLALAAASCGGSLAPVTEHPASPYDDPTLTTVAAASPPSELPYRLVEFRLRRAWMLDGHHREPGTSVYGVVKGEGAGVPWTYGPSAVTPTPIGESLYFYTGLESGMDRVDLRTGEVERVPFATLEKAFAHRLSEEGSAYVGIVDDGHGDPGGLLTVALIGLDGRVKLIVDHVRSDLSWVFRDGTGTPVESLGGGGFVVHHTDGDKNWIDVVYNPEGVQVSPATGMISRELLVDDDARDTPYYFGYAGEARTIWPFAPDGSLIARPSGCIGVRAFHGPRWFAGWGALWDTPEGRRWSFAASTSWQDAVAARERAEWEELDVAILDDNATVVLVGRTAAAGGYVIRPIGDDSVAPRYRQVFPTMAAALAEIGAPERERNAAAAAAYDAYHANLERSQREAATRRADLERTLRPLIDALVAQGDYARAVELPWQLDPQTIAKVVVAGVQAGKAAELRPGDISLARTYAPERAAMLTEALRSLQATAYASYLDSQSAARDARTAPNAGTTTTSPARPSTQDIMNATREQSQLDYLSGAQHWQFGRSFEVKR